MHVFALFQFACFTVLFFFIFCDKTINLNLKNVSQQLSSLAWIWFSKIYPIDTLKLRSHLPDLAYKILDPH